MSYNRKTWQNRNSEHPYRRTLTDTTSGTSQTVDVIRAEGVITTEGDAFDANTMNNMEGRIADEFSLVNQKLGDLTQLETEAKNSLVEAINEVAESGGGGGSSTLAGLTDTNIVNQTNGQILKWDSMILKWVNADEGNGGTASSVAYDNTDSGLQATDVQEAIDEVAGGYVKKDFAIIEGTASIMATASNDAAVNATGNATNSANMGVYNSEVDGSMHMNMSTTGKKELVVFDANATRSVVIAQDAAGNYSGDLIDMIDEKADIASPAFTGSPTAPTQSKGNSSTRIATTAFVNNEIDNDTKYHVGDSFSVAGTACLFLQSGTSARITIPLCKPVGSDVTSAANSGNWEIRDCNGSTTNGDKTTSGHPLSYYVTTPSSDLKVIIGTNTINILLTNLKASTWGSTSRYTVGSAYANGGNSITFS